MLGWLISTPDHEWWKATNLAAVQHDLYSIAHHEIGHSLIFHPNYDRFGHFANIGIVSDADVAIYHGDYPNIDRFYHLPGTIDRLSGWGAFGNEFHNDFPYGRWLVTKLDLLVTQSVGYDLRFTSPFVHLSFSDGELVNGSVMKPFIDTLSVIGGIPPYYWTLEQGKLPSGLSLDSFTGTFFGTPAEAGSFDLTVRVREYSESSLSDTVHYVDYWAVAICTSGSSLRRPHDKRAGPEWLRLAIAPHARLLRRRSLAWYLEIESNHLHPSYRSSQQKTPHAIHPPC